MTKAGRRAAIGLLGLAALVACAGGGKVGPGSPVHGLRVQVREFELDRAIVIESAGPNLAFQVADRIAERLRERGVDAQATALRAPAAADVVVEGKVVTIDGGSRAARYWAGFGAGAARVGVEGRVVRADGRVVGEFADERRCGMGAFGGDSDLLLEKCAREVGDDVAEMIRTGEYRRTF